MYHTQLTRRALTEDSDTVHAVLLLFFLFIVVVVVVFVAAAVVAVPFVSMSVSIFIVS